ncbi:hypothetical protein [Amycolatopsis sp. CA-128772]|uniref:hypothetical protein n=1 Tax=Amycolatopsis sp. CA-128772 TaxID=2073159 RepID=UPI001E4DAAEB|nr:hypothetical protein [Amycolatopsis sp. CA-128772]
MARRAPRPERVTVAELLGRSGAPRDRYRDEDTLVFPQARHREKPQALRSLSRLRVFSVVAGALALTGGVSAAVSMPPERTAGATWPPAGLEPPTVALVPLPADVVVPPAKPAPKTVAPTPEPDDVTSAADRPESNSAVVPAAHRGKLARAVQLVDRVKETPKPKLPPQVAPVRHEIPDVPLWSRGRPERPDWQAMMTAGRRSAGHPAVGHHGCGGGRHRR